MKNERLILSTLLLVLLLGILAVTVQPALARFGFDRQPAANALGAPEAWKVGVTLEGSPAYAGIAGRLLTEAASFRSAAGTQDIYFVFPAASSHKVVQSARYYLLRRTGEYSGTAALTLEVRQLDGALKQVVSVAPVDLEVAPAGEWQDLPLSAAAADLAIGPGDYLAFHFQLSDAAGGDLDVRPIFDVVIR